MLLQSISLISIFVFLSSIQFCQVKGQCIDQPGVIQNGMTCLQLNPLNCYDATVLSKCCQSCTAVYTGVTGCAYGDKVPNCIAVLCKFYTDPSECCNTCKPATTASPPSTSTTTTTMTATPQSMIATTTTTTQQTTIATTTTLKPTILTTTATTKMTSTSAMSTTSSLQVPAAPSVSIVSQTTRNITLNVTLQAGSRANEFEIKAITGVAQKMSLPAGNVSVDYVFSDLNDAGTCFTLQIVAINSAGRSAVTIMSNACYAPLPPIVTTVTQTTSNVTLNLTLPQGSLGNTFEVKVTGGGTTRYAPYSVGEFRFIQYVFDAAAEAGVCFVLEFVTIVTNNPIKSETTMVSNACYAPKKPEVTVITQTTSNVTLRITLPVGSLGNTIEVKATGGGTARSMPIPVGMSKSIQHMLDIVAEAGTCFILEAVILVTNNPITSDKTTVSNVCYAPQKPDVTVATQSTSNITLSITLPMGSLGNNFEVNVQGGVKTQSVPLALGTSRSVQHMFNDMAEAGTCFNLDIVTRVTNNHVKSDKATVSNACYAPKRLKVNVITQITSNVTLTIMLPTGSLGNTLKSRLKEAGRLAPKKPEVNVVTQTTRNITMNITLPAGSLGNTFEVKVTGGVTSRSMSLYVGGSRSVQHVFNEVAEAGTCFSLEIVTIVNNNPIKSDTTTVTSSCYVPLKPTTNISEQTMNYITFKIALQAGSTGKSFYVNVIGGKEYVVGIPEGSTYVQFVFNETGIPGTCFTLQVKTVSFRNLTQSEASSIPNTCYAPMTPEVYVVETTIKSIKLNISIPYGSSTKSFQIRRTSDIAETVYLPPRTTSVLYVFDNPADAGTADNPADAGTGFTFEIVGIAADDMARTSFPVSPGSLSSKDKMIMAVSSAGGLILLCGAAAVLFAIIMKRRRASWVINENKQIHLQGGKETTDQYRTITETSKTHLTTSEFIIQPKLISKTTRDES